MRVIVALIKPKEKSEKEIRRILTDAGLEIHDTKTMYVAETTKPSIQ